MARLILLLLAPLLLLASHAAEPREIVVASFNLENYVGPRDPAEGPHQAREKSRASIAAIIEIVREINPDILGVCEMGKRPVFESFRAELAAAGLPFIDSEFVDGPDVDRHLALLTKLPIVARKSEPDLSYEIGGAPQKVRRGILDVTVRAENGYELRLVGAHLKSKLPANDGESLMRRHEAQMLRRHCDAVLDASPTANLLVYGDFNALKDEPAVQEISGVRSTARFLSPVPLADSQGDRWTHYFKEADLYSRVDYFFASSAILREIVQSHSGIFRSPRWNEASDHRPIFTSILPLER